MPTTTFQRTFHHLVAATHVLNDDSIPPPPPLHPAPAPAPVAAPFQPLPPPTPAQQPTPATQEIKIIAGQSVNSKCLLSAGFRYSKDGQPLVDGRQSWRCYKRVPRCPGRLYIVNNTFHSVGKLHYHSPVAADYNAAIARAKIKQMASSSQNSNHAIYCAVTGALPSESLARLPGKSALKKCAQIAC